MAENPAQTYPYGASVADISTGNGLWFLIHARTRDQKLAAFELAALSIPYFMPMYRNRMKCGQRGQRGTTLLPLFPGYISAFVPTGSHELVYSARRISQVEPIHQQDRHTKDLAFVEAAIAHDAIRPYDKLVVGMDYTVRSGAFQGFRGTLVESDGESHFVIQIEWFGRPCILEIQPELLEPV